MSTQESTSSPLDAWLPANRDPTMTELRKAIESFYEFREPVRHAHEVTFVANMLREDRIKFLEGVADKRGQSAADRLYLDVQIELRKRRDSMSQQGGLL